MTTASTAANMAGPLFDREECRLVIVRELTRQVKKSRLPKSLGDAVFAQFSKSGDPEEPECSLFGITTLYTFHAAGVKDWRLASPLAAAVEFAAAAASVLDDIQDLDPVKGIDPDLPGADAELLTLLLVLSQNAIDSLEISTLTSDRVDASCRLINRFELVSLAGQHEANLSSVHDGLTASLEMTAAKSGSFGRLAAETGAALATPDGNVVARLGGFGWHLAIVDQLQNDVAGVWPNGDASTDLQLGRATPPISFASHLAAGEPAGAAQASVGVGRFHEPRVAFTGEALFASGAIHFAWVMAAIHHARAQRIAREEKSRNPASRLADLLRS